VLTLFLVPVVYLLFDRARGRVRAKRPAVVPIPAAAEAE
jgi:hypothetical protein